MRKFLPKYGHVYVTIQSHGLSAGARAHYVTPNGVRNGLGARGTSVSVPPLSIKGDKGGQRSEML